MERYVLIDIHDDDHRIDEGGASRAMAIRRYVLGNIKGIKRLYLPKSKLRIVKHFAYLLFAGNKTLIYIYPEVGFDIIQKDKKRKLITDIWFRLIRGKKLIFDIADIKYEQAKDLEIYRYDHDRMRDVEKEFFALPADFIFASSSMREYAVSHFDIPLERTDVCINGGNKVTGTSPLPFEKKEGETLFVYSGTLNKGRSIEKMIGNFPEDPDKKLILMGPEGEWTRDILKDNMIYLGALPEEKAHNIVSGCDVGLIPYDNERLYYNLAYPTKLSFYLTAGIPVLSTPVSEFNKINEIRDIGWGGVLDSWSEIISSLDGSSIAAKKERAKQISDQFLWDNILKQNRFIVNEE